MNQTLIYEHFEASFKNYCRYLTAKNEMDNIMTHLNEHNLNTKHEPVPYFDYLGAEYPSYEDSSFKQFQWSCYLLINDGYKYLGVTREYLAQIGDSKLTTRIYNTIYPRFEVKVKELAEGLNIENNILNFKHLNGVYKL
jgi:hypothetical protein